METCQTLGLINKIDSPVSAFNNILLQINKEISNIYQTDVFKTQNCIFFDDSMLLFGFIKFQKINNEIGFKFTGFITDNLEKYVRITLDNSDKLRNIFNKYLFLLNDVQNNFDKSVSIRYINTIIDDINSFDEKQLVNQYYLIPLKEKIFKNYDNFKEVERDKTLEVILLKYSYLITFAINGPKQVKFTIFRVLSSDLDESKSLNNIRFLEKEIIKNGLIQKGKQLRIFLTKLLIYGEF